MATESGAVNEYTDEYGRKFEAEGLKMVDKIKENDFMVATQVFSVEIERALDNIDSVTGSTGDDGSASAPKTSVKFGDGKVKLLTQTLDLSTALGIEAFDGGREEKEKADEEKAARAEAEKKAKEQGDRAE